MVAKGTHLNPDPKPQPQPQPPVNPNHPPTPALDQNHRLLRASLDLPPPAPAVPAGRAAGCSTAWRPLRSSPADQQGEQKSGVILHDLMPSFVRRIFLVVFCVFSRCCRGAAGPGPLSFFCFFYIWGLPISLYVPRVVLASPHLGT